MRNTKMLGTVHVARTVKNCNAYDLVIRSYKKEIDNHQVIAFERLDFVGDFMDIELATYAKEQGKTLVQLDTDIIIAKLRQDLFNILNKEGELQFFQNVIDIAKDYIADRFSITMAMSLIKGTNLDMDSLKNDPIIISIIEKLFKETFTGCTDECTVDFKGRMDKVDPMIMKRDENWDIQDATLLIVGNNHVVKYSN